MGKRSRAVVTALALFGVWMLATYLLEARVGAFIRPDTTNRFVYTAVANVLVGTIGSALVIREIVPRAELPGLTTYGIATPARIVALVPLAAVL